MSRTYLRCCKKTVEGLYMNCPLCGADLLGLIGVERKDNPPTPSERVPEAELDELVDLIEDELDNNGPGGKTTKFIKSEIAAYAQQTVETFAKEIKEDMKQHTVPEGYDLVTRSYLNNTIDFKLAELRSHNQKKGQ